MQIFYLALLYCHLFVQMEDAYSLMDKAVAKEPSNDIIKCEKLFMQYYDGQQEEAEEFFKTLKSQMKDQAIIQEITTFFTQKKKINNLIQQIFELFGSEQWEKANALVDQNPKELGGVNPNNLDLYRMKMNILRALNKTKELGQFYDNLAKQAPNQNGYYQYAGDVYMEIGMKNAAIKSYAKYYSKEYSDMEALTKYLEIIDKNT
ncbi:hypothetical protein ABPG72_021099 [Tetrahymena utriculariae]